MNPSQAAGIALIAFGLTEFVLRRGATAKSIKTTASDRGTTPLIFVCYAAVVLLLRYPNLPGTILPVAAAWTGVGIAYGGLGVRWWAMLVLGRFYTRTLTTTADQNVVRRGPYRWIRHPGYLGSLLTWGGAAGASGNVLVLVLVTVVLAAVYVRRMTVEELMLTETLGQAYRDYQQRSWRLIPFCY